MQKQIYREFEDLADLLNIRLVTGKGNFKWRLLSCRKRQVCCT